MRGTQFAELSLIGQVDVLVETSGGDSGQAALHRAQRQQGEDGQHAR